MDPLQIQQPNEGRRQAGVIAGILKRLSKLERTRKLAGPWQPFGTAGGIAFAAGWGNQGGVGNGTAEYRFHANGEIELRGLVANGALPAAPSVIATLPAGFRVTSDRDYSVMSNGAFGWVDISVTNEIRMRAGNASFVSLDGIRYEPQA